VSWKNVALGDVCKVIAGQSPESINYNKEGRGLAFYQGKKDFGDVYVNPPTVWTTEITKEAIKNDILMSVRAPVGPVNIATENICIGRGLAAIRATERINQAYLFYYLLKIEKELVGNAGAVFNSINKTQIENLLVPLPSIPTQQKIVAKLDAVFAEIDVATAAAEANAKNAEALFQSYLTEVFERFAKDCEQRKLKDISIYMGRGKSKHRPRNDDSLYGGIYPFIQTGDVRNAKKYISSFTQTYNEKGLSQSKLWQANTVCITIAANIAEIGILNFDACFPDSVIGIVVNREKISEEFLYFMLLFEQQMIKSKSKGSAQENINLGTFEDMLFNIPNKIEQENFVIKLNHNRDLVNSLLNSQLKKIDSLISLKQSILQKAFSGELVKD
jgi:type I restriction enzyme S subunit